MPCDNYYIYNIRFPCWIIQYNIMLVMLTQNIQYLYNLGKINENSTFISCISMFFVLFLYGKECEEFLTIPSILVLFWPVDTVLG